MGARVIDEILLTVTKERLKWAAILFCGKLELFVL
jgi:hypothetical protein